LHHEELSLETASGSPLSGPPVGTRGSPRWWMLLLVIWCLGAAYAGVYLKRGWIPHDDGAFAQSADRVLHGELPHRDYTEIYTGGLAYLNAFAFRCIGEDLATLRIVLYVFFLLWIPVFYWIASNLVRDWVAAGVTLLAVVWSLPNYPAAVASWYNLFFATFGLAALFAYLSNRSWKWLFVAGLCGGCSFLVKSVACFYFMGVLLSLVFFEQCEAHSRAGRREARSSTLYSAFVVSSLLLFFAGLALLIREHGSAEEILNFVVPSSILATLVLLRERGLTNRSSRERFLALFRTTLPFGLGFLVPMFGFLIPYLRGNALHEFLNGVFLLPFKRVWGAFMTPPPLFTVLPLLLLLGILALGAQLRGRARWVLSFVFAFPVAYYLFSSAYDLINYQVVWHAAYWITPPLACLGVFVLSRGTREGVLQANTLEEQQLFLVLAVSFLCALVQYPFSAPPYFCYVAPLLILAAVAVLRAFPSIPQPLLAIVFGCFFLFAVLRMAPTYIYALGYSYMPDRVTRILDLPRGGKLRVEPELAKTYEQLIPLIQEHAGTGEIYAAPDCPAVYFLAGYKNPTRALFDFLEGDYHDSERILKFVDSHPIRVIVVNKGPSFSMPFTFDVRKALMQRFPQGRDVGTFEVRWR
jgi:hypothetical protein